MDAPSSEGGRTTAEPISSDAFSYVFSDRRRKSDFLISTVSRGFRDNVFIDATVLNDEKEVLFRICEEIDVLRWIATVRGQFTEFLHANRGLPSADRVSKKM
jgi:hypothetical protein